MEGVVTAAAKLSIYIYFNISWEQIVYILLYELYELFP